MMIDDMPFDREVCLVNSQLI
ncbi:hypothetical protein BOS5A_230133 [Bosea sp. EC-HK365B]|nr:hypothetical protein BOSE21B_90209 [Bosea sp. 21B]VVT60856.1 hypothetical protein BOS5A_230133 [Bosea sp. EC-HK365B]